jgi:hypothetical protein
MADSPQELGISPEKVAWVIELAREFEAKVAPFDDPDAEDQEEEQGAILENRRDDPTVKELQGFFAGLNDDEEAALVAISWIGRGTYSADDYETAVTTATAEKTTRTSGYLLGMPLLSEYLADGLNALGYSAAEEEAEIET